MWRKNRVFFCIIYTLKRLMLIDRVFEWEGQNGMIKISGKGTRHTLRWWPLKLFQRFLSVILFCRKFLFYKLICLFLIPVVLKFASCSHYFHSSVSSIGAVSSASNFLVLFNNYNIVLNACCNEKNFHVFFIF